MLEWNRSKSFSAIFLFFTSVKVNDNDHLKINNFNVSQTGLVILTIVSFVSTIILYLFTYINDNGTSVRVSDSCWLKLNIDSVKKGELRLFGLNCRKIY